MSQRKWYPSRRWIAQEIGSGSARDCYNSHPQPQCGPTYIGGRVRLAMLLSVHWNRRGFGADNAVASSQTRKWCHWWKNQRICALVACVAQIVYSSWMISAVSLFMDNKVGRRFWWCNQAIKPAIQYNFWMRYCWAGAVGAEKILIDKGEKPRIYLS